MIPKGTHQPTGRLATISDPYRDPHPIQGTRPMLVDCLCICGNLTTITTSRFLSGNTKSCGCLKRERPGVIAAALQHDKGPMNLRQPSRYGPGLLTIQGNLICPWPLCLRPLYLPVSVDHDRRHCDNVKCCALCPRGLVHHGCNTKIATIEGYRDSLGLPDSVIEYLDSTPRTEPVSYSIRLADYSGGWASRYGIPVPSPEVLQGRERKR
jgi:hypothetical protein